ncbi:Beta-mannosyltransferase 1 [Candida viswanathii]|uniref:Beta-mannosyltransferase 1 n=1 Tax=Candida viswanathii TaxID=5486 RepID=A0A367XYN9_9ASCO|nr:Beta-mannosyltransferase 1 [Candida viswanathii]
MNSVSYSKLGLSKKPIRRQSLLLVLICAIALLSIGTVLVYSRYEFLQELTSPSRSTEQHEQTIHRHQTDHKDKKIIIFPNNFEVQDKKLADFYINNLELALDPQDLIYRNRFTHKAPDNVPYKPYDVELFDAGVATSNLGECLQLSSKIQVEASLAYNKNADLPKILTRFMEEDSPYYREVKDFFPELAQQLAEGTIEEHWYHLIGSSVWLKQYGVHLMISRIMYTDSDQGLGVISLSYLQVFDRNWNELDNVELIVRNEDGLHKPLTYPQFAPIPMYHNVKRKYGQFYGIEDPRIQMVINKNGEEEPIIIFNSFHRKIKEAVFEKDYEAHIQYDKYRSIFLGWLWRTQMGKVNLEELPDATLKHREYIKIKEMVRPNNDRKGIEKNWALFLNYDERREQGYDSNVHFIYQFKDTKILKCSMYDDEVCKWEFETNEHTGSGKFHGGTELININQLLDEYDYSQLESIKERIPTGRQIWIGFARAVLKDCGCGTHLYRPNLIILMKDNEKYKFAYASPFIDFGIEALEWWIGKGLCTAKNLIIPNGISSWTIEKDSEGGLMDYMSFTITRRDSTIDLVHLRGMLSSLLFSNTNPKLLNQEQRGFKTNTNLDCALTKSDEFCKIYGEGIKVKEKFAAKEKEEAAKHKQD